MLYPTRSLESQWPADRTAAAHSSGPRPVGSHRRRGRRPGTDDSDAGGPGGRPGSCFRVAGAASAARPAAAACRLATVTVAAAAGTVTAEPEGRELLTVALEAVCRWRQCAVSRLSFLRVTARVSQAASHGSLSTTD